MEDLNPKEDEVIDPSNPEGESENEDLEFLDEDFEDETEEPKKPADSDDALAVYNEELKKRGLNKNYKSWDDVATHEKAIDTHFAKKGMDKVIEPKKEDAPVVLNPQMSERLLKLEEPDSKFVIDEIKKNHPDADPYEVWNSSEYYKKEASARAETERNKQRIANPAGNTEGQPEVDEIEQKFINNLPSKYKK
jgi:hypothetical protein